jgi:hypothetical protein
MGLYPRAVALVVFMLPGLASAVQVQINITTPFVYIQIGHGQYGGFGLFGPPAGQVDEVAFTFPPGVTPGDGTPIVGTPTIPIAVLGYRRGRRVRFTVTMNSSVPLINGAGDTLPFSEISWTTRDGDIPGGTFSQGAAQTLMNINLRWPRGRGVIDYLTFRYDNDTVFAAGTYTGRVVYTIALL